jgi:hypothetical protein
MFLLSVGHYSCNGTGSASPLLDSVATNFQIDWDIMLKEISKQYISKYKDRCAVVV